MSDFKLLVDIVFTVDTTGSMGGFVGYAKNYMNEILSDLVGAGVDLRCGIVEYRDHPPEDNTFVCRVHRFGNDTMCSHSQAAKSISRLSVDGGGDAPEAVYDGVYAAATVPAWRQGAHRRIILLVGDAPPQGASEHKIESSSRSVGRWPHKTPSGIGLHECTAAAEKRSISVYAACLTHDPCTLDEFQRIARMTGGVAYGLAGGRSDNPVKKIIDGLAKLSKDAAAVHGLIGQGISEPADIAEKLGFRISRVEELISVLNV